MFEQVKNILSKYTEVKDIKEDSVLTSDLGLSSFDLVSIINDFEDTFDIEILDGDLRRFISVSDVLAYLDACL